MLVSKNALAKLVNLKGISTQDLRDLYNNYGGLEVEAVYPVVPPNNYLIGHILAVKSHPDSDTLHICQVDVGKEQLQIVCGAANVAKDQFVMVAPVGITMPDGTTIHKRDIRGVTSSGMICSLAEIGVDPKYLSAQQQAGIFVFDQEENVIAGADALTVLDLKTEVFDLSITPNRADCLNYRGLTYETAALLKRQHDATAFTYERPVGSFSIKDYVQTLQVTSEKVKQYHLMAFQNVRIKPAPQWMQSFLLTHDIRPINNVVDITNYVMLFLGLPLHAFDAHKLPKKQIIVRQARDNENLVTLDSKKRTLSHTDIVISTGEESIALAGVMGGENTEIEKTTTSVVLEAAIFDPASVHLTALRLDLRSEASQRMEKLLDPTLPQLALALTSELLQKYAGAQVSADMLSYEQTPTVRQSEIIANYQAIAKKIGSDISAEAIRDILDRLSFPYTVLDPETISIIPPSWRPDIRIFEDIVEEVARLHGLDKLPNTLPIDISRPVFRSDQSLFFDHVHQTLQALGLQEILTYTLCATDQATLGQYKSDLLPVKILHPLNTERETLRTTTYYSMLETLQYHYNHAFNSAAFYEITDVYGQQESYPVLSIGGFGAIEWQKLYNLNTTIDFFLLKTWFERILRAINPLDITYERTENSLFHQGIAADIYFKKEYLGTFGKIHPQIAKTWDFYPEVYVGQLFIAKISQLESDKSTQTSIYHPIRKFPSIERDIALLVARDLPVGALLASVRKHGGSDCRHVSVFDVYTGEHVLPEEKSVALHITFQSRSRTLTSQFVNEKMNHIITALAEELGATLRK